MPTLTAHDVDQAFSGEIRRVPVTAGYRLRLLAVLTGLILLQALYLALIALVVALGIAYTLLVLSIGIRINYLTILIYLGPPTAAAILTFFLLKPIFARPLPPPEAVRLTPESEPVLFQFVDRLCRLVGSPTPKVIYTDLAVNASASLQGWKGFFTGDLALTIGIPLVRGLTLPQFTGVLAHEFGHFSQRAGMRSYFLIQTIRHWFARVVYERDSWDAWLEQGGDNEGWRMKTVRAIAGLGVLIGRKYLTLLMKAAQWLSASFSRQMEFDADRYEASVVGPEVFAQTSLRIPELSNGASIAWDSVRTHYRLGRLPDDVAVLVERHTERLPGQTREAIREQTLAAATETNDSHPATQQRIDSARAWGTPGCFTLHGPAARLFADLDAIGRQATQHHYRLELGPHLTSRSLIAADAVTRFIEDESIYRDALLAGGIESTSIFDWFTLPATVEPLPEIPFAFDSAQYQELLQTWFHHAGVVQLLSAGARLDQNLEEQKQKAVASRQAWGQLYQQAAAQAHSLGTKLLATAPLEVLACQRALEGTRDAMLHLRLQSAEADCFRNNVHLFDAATAANHVEAATRRAQVAAQRWLSALDSALPSAVILNPAQPPTLAAQLLGEDGQCPAPDQLYSRWSEIYIGTLGRLCWHSCQVHE